MAPILVCALLVLGAASPRVAANPLLPRARQLLRSFQEEAALRVLERARRWPQNSPRELAEAYLLTGLAQAALAREREAVEAFRQARLLAPDLSLPKGAAPRVEDWWRQAAPEAEASEAEAATGPPRTEPAASPSPGREGQAGSTVSPAIQESPAPVTPAEVSLSTPTSPPPALAPREVPSEPASTAVAAPSGSSPAKVVRWVGVGGLAAGAAVVLVGVSQGLSAQSHQARSEALVPVGESLAEHQAGAAAATRANWLYGVGAVLAVAGGVTFAFSF